MATGLRSRPATAPAAVVVWAQVAATAVPDPLHQLVGDVDVVVAAGPGWHHVALPAPITRADSLTGAFGLTCRPGRTP